MILFISIAIGFLGGFLCGFAIYNLIFNHPKKGKKTEEKGGLQ